MGFERLHALTEERQLWHGGCTQLHDGSRHGGRQVTGNGLMAGVLVSALGVFIARDLELSATQKGLVVAAPACS